MERITPQHEAEEFQVWLRTCRAQMGRAFRAWRITAARMARVRLCKSFQEQQAASWRLRRLFSAWSRATREGLTAALEAEVGTMTHPHSSSHMLHTLPCA